MFTDEVCMAARGLLSHTEQQELQREARRRACSENEALLQVALERFQRPRYSLNHTGHRLVLVKG